MGQNIFFIPYGIKLHVLYFGKVGKYIIIPVGIYIAIFLRGYIYIFQCDIYIYIRLITWVSVKYDKIFHE